MEERVFNAALAGLLHDVGKFGLRAKVGASLNDPQVKSDYKRAHALHTDDFIETYLPAKWETQIKPLAANHHWPTQRQEYIIAAANRLSAGAPSDEGEDDSNVHPRQLLSIFSILEADQYTPAKEEWKYWPLSTLALDEQTESGSLFPDQAWSDEKVYGAYAQLWREFCGQMETLKEVHTPNGDMETYLESVLLLMQRYTWCIPSAKYNGRPDTSLYDHSRMTAALAAVIAESDLPDETIKVLTEKPEECNEPIALLVGGDISGVQDFIYTITNRGATSALRGRSFYLQLLTEAVARYILRWLELPITNLIYAGGGNFFLVARATDQKKLREIQQTISRILYKHHKGDLYLAVAGVLLQASDFVQVIDLRHKLSRKWDDLTKELQINKQRRFAELPEDDLKILFEPQGHGGDRDGQCRVCGNEHPNAQPDKEAATADDPDGVRKCPPCLSYENLGKKLRIAQYLVWEILPRKKAHSELEPNFVSQSWEDVIADLEIKVDLCEKIKDQSGVNKNRRVTLALKEQAWTGLKADSHNAVGRRIFVNVTPKVSELDVADFADKLEEKIKPGDIKPFSLLEMQSEGIQRLGILRMDVDNLGKIFAKGLGEYATLSRIASLSFAVSLYFEGWVGVLAEKRNHREDQKYKDRLYSIYSGGDDLFFVGSWDEVAELAREIRADLTHYAAEHPGIHASAGIVLVGGKYPLAKAAQDAHEEEQASKHHAWWDETGKIHEKDVVNFLGQAINWKRFGLEHCKRSGIEETHALMHFLTKVVEVNNANHSLIRLLVRLDERYREAEDRRRKTGSDQNRGGHPQPLWGPWNWLAYYYLKRRFKVEADDALKQDMDDLAEVLRGDFHIMEWLGLAARWAELSNRKPNK
jgi:CRISPR-associated protein Csm1